MNSSIPPIKTKRKRILAAVMFTDVVGYTRMMEENEEKTLEKIRRHRSVLQQFTQQYQGKILQYYGDASLSYYHSAIDAVRCAMDMQQAYQQPPRVPLRIGIHMGEIVVDEDDIYGDAINVASRIESLGVANSILISGKIHGELKNHPEISAIGVGAFEFKNVSDPVKVFAIQSAELEAPTELATENPKAARVQPKPSQRSAFLRWLPTALLSLALLLFIFRGPIFNYTKQSTDGANRLAVLTFENRAPETESDPLGRIAADWITRGLMEQEAIAVTTPERMDDVVPKNTFSLHQMGDPLAFIEDTRADQVIEGAYFIQGDSIYFSASLVDVEVGNVLYSFPPEASAASEPLQAIEQLRNRICGYWASRESMAAELNHPPTLDAYREYMLARDYWAKDYKQALHHLERSIGMDSTFLAPQILRMSLFYNTGKYAQLETTLAHFTDRKASLSRYHRNQIDYFTYVVAGDHQEAARTFEKLYEINHQDRFANNTMAVNFLERLNDPRRALAVLKKIDNSKTKFEECDYCLQNIRMQAECYKRLGEYDQALEIIRAQPLLKDDRKSRELEVRLLIRSGQSELAGQLIDQIAPESLNGDFRYLYFVAAQEARLNGQEQMAQFFGQRAYELYTHPDLKPSKRMLARVQYHLGDYDAVESYCELMLENHEQDIFSLGLLGTVFAQTDRKEQALRVIDFLNTLDKKFPLGYKTYWQARIFAQLDMKQEALTYLRTALNQGLMFTPYNLTNDPDLIPLHNDSLFLELTRLKGMD